SRMIFSSLEQMGKAPFHTVVIHGLVRDSQGRKMSKSLGNGIDPLEIIDQYGADALRFALATGNSPGNDMRFSDEKIEAARNFANKLWNASRFVRMNLTIDKTELPAPADLALEDKWILTRLNETAATVTAALNKFEVGVALSALYDFTWDIFCDWYIELAKTRLNAKDTPENITAQKVIAYVLTQTLKLLHPFMPFITEEIYLSLPHDEESIMISAYPAYDDVFNYEDEAAKMERVIAAIRAIRTRRNEMNVPPSRRAKVYIATTFADSYNEKTAVFFGKLASASEVIVAPTAEGFPSPDACVQLVTDSASIYLPLADIIDLDAERKRLTGERDRVAGEIKRLEGKLANAGFVAKAPAAVVEGERVKLEKYRDTLAGIEAALGKL
ncbi:MAG: class I tRNA ligase family protein, partial [Clostridia bacterium]|nr:class I tRNA ligase family protein [Clostridia bacterium]